MCVRRLGGGLLAAVLTIGVASSCSDDPTSCDDLRRQLADAEAARPESDAVWNDIEDLQDDVAEVLRLRAELDDRCT